MRTSLLLSVVLLASPALAQSKDMRVSSYEMSETGGVVLLESDTPIGEPWLKVEAKQIRIWFPEVKYVARFEHARDAQEPLRSLELRPGAQDTAVLRIELAPGQRLTRDHVEITRQGLAAKVQVRLPSNLPVPVPVPVPAPAAQPTATKPLYPQPQAQHAHVQPRPAAAAAATPAPAATPGAVQNIRAAAAASDAERGLNFASGSNGGLTGLAVISALLLAVYAAIRTFGKKRAARDPDIQVLSARRLGHRSELLLVRALGSDHLLMTSAGRVERVASAPSPSDAVPTLTLPPQLSAAADPGDTADSQAEGLGIITKLSSRSRLRKLLDAVDHEPIEPADPEAAPAPAPRSSARPPFGPELLSAIHHHKLNAIASLPSLAQNATKQSDAVAGIARLRAGTRSSN